MKKIMNGIKSFSMKLTSSINITIRSAIAPELASRGNGMQFLLRYGMNFINISKMVIQVLLFQNITAQVIRVSMKVKGSYIILSKAVVFIYRKKVAVLL